MMTPGIQQREHQLLDMFLSHPLADSNFSKALMNSYIGTLIPACTVMYVQSCMYNPDVQFQSVTILQ